MRNTALALVLAVLASLGGFVPRADVVAPAAAAILNPKVVIIVGATHSATASYRTRADAAYAEAIKYTSNVVKIYSPDATWPVVKEALQGASVVVYMGHGNGFPSPYRTTLWAYGHDGFGLNAVAGQGDNNNVYYGEHYIASEVTLAPNAVVLLHHLCYAAGNSEPGQAEPTVDVAMQRADNYATGFLKAGAQAVIADGLSGPGYYLKALFTTSQTIDQLWRAAPNYKNQAFAFGSVRSPGYTVEMDPNLPTSGFYRALTGRMSLTTAEVTGVTAGADAVPPPPQPLPPPPAPPVVAPPPPPPAPAVVTPPAVLAAPAAYEALGQVASGPARFYAQDEDRLAKFTTLSFVLSSPATVSWQVTRPDESPVLTILENTALDAGTHTYRWSATDQAGTRVPAGTYVSVVRATDGVLESTQKTSVETNAFALRSSVATAVRGRLVTITGITAESLGGYATLRVSQPGIRPWSVRMTKVASLTWRATVRLKSSSRGTVTFRVSALDKDGRWQATNLVRTLR